MTHLKRQKLISSTQARGYNTQFLLYPRPLMKYLNPRLRYWKCASCFDFYLFKVIGKSFCISLSNFVIIGLSEAKL